MIEVKVARAPHGSVVKTMTGDVLASFSNDLAAEQLLGVLITGLAAKGVAVFDADRGDYIAGTVDLLDAPCSG